MDRKQVFILTLTLLGLLFLFGFGAGFGFNAARQPNPYRYEPATWLEWLGDWMAPFAPSVDTARLRCNGQSVRTTFLLTAASPTCTMTIPAAGEKYRKGILELRGGEPTLRVRVDYQPAGEAAGQPAFLTAKQKMRLVFLDQGGKLTLTCDGCRVGQGRDIRLKLN